MGTAIQHHEGTFSETFARSSVYSKDADRICVAGVPVDVIGEEEIVEILDRAVSTRNQVVLANMNVHGLYCALQSSTMLRLLQDEKTIVHIDGTPILWLAKMLGTAVPPKARNAHIDLIPNLLRRCRDMGWRVAIVGSDAEGARENKRVFSCMVPGLEIETFDGMFEIGRAAGHETPREAQIVEALVEFKPHLLLVGMGMPRQEEWIAKIYGRTGAAVIMPVGGFTDYFTGRTRMAPRFLGPLGLEWAYRLVSEPKRLWFRYMVEPFLLVGLLAQATASGAVWGKQTSGRGPI